MCKQHLAGRQPQQLFQSFPSCLCRGGLRVPLPFGNRGPAISLASNLPSVQHSRAPYQQGWIFSGHSPLPGLPVSLQLVKQPIRLGDHSICTTGEDRSICTVGSVISYSNPSVNFCPSNEGLGSLRQGCQAAVHGSLRPFTGTCPGPQWKSFPFLPA